MQRQTADGGLVFDTPEDVLRTELIDRREKINRLEVWRDRVLHRLDSTNEGMPPNGTTDHDVRLLEAIEAALSALDDRSGPHGPTWRERQRAAETASTVPRDGPCPRG